MEFKRVTTDARQMGGVPCLRGFRSPVATTIHKRRGLLHALTAVLVLFIGATTVTAEMIEKTGTFGGLSLTYKVVLPPAYDPSRTYPVVLVFTGGSQQMRGAEGTVNTDWRQEAERRGYIVISPASPDGRLFFEGADRVFPSFLDQILKDYHVRNGKLHVAGHSNGGISAFHVAALYPSYFATVTGYPGLLDGPARAKAVVLKPMCLFMHVGDRDDGWRGEMQRQSQVLAKAGYRVRFAVEPNQVHRLKAGELNLSARLFDQIESCVR
jgi:poly(3-hydroxybutyrate) depolymerase